MKWHWRLFGQVFSFKFRQSLESRRNSKIQHLLRDLTIVLSSLKQLSWVFHVWHGRARVLQIAWWRSFRAWFTCVYKFFKCLDLLWLRLEVFCFGESWRFRDFLPAAERASHEFFLGSETGCFSHDSIRGVEWDSFPVFVDSSKLADSITGITRAKFLVKTSFFLSSFQKTCAVQSELLKNWLYVEVYLVLAFLLRRIW